ncbi:hypothetical protein NB311A_02471 [Nitrobacter sp. Nb-311A]|nr:hypothetical protein NB311A_02471 [Nitrobacter sp. Nb-311A]
MEAIDIAATRIDGRPWERDVETQSVSEADKAP